MGFLGRKPRLLTTRARELREVWLFTAGQKPGMVDTKLSRAWSIHKDENITPSEYESLHSEIMQHYQDVKESDRVKWARLEWNGFDPLPVTSIFNAEEGMAG